MFDILITSSGKNYTISVRKALGTKDFGHKITIGTKDFGHKMSLIIPIITLGVWDSVP